MQLGDSSSLQDFKQLFQGADFHTGLELAFSSTPEGALAARIGDREVRCPALRRWQLLAKPLHHSVTGSPARSV